MFPKVLASTWLKTSPRQGEELYQYDEIWNLAKVQGACFAKWNFNFPYKFTELMIFVDLNSSSTMDDTSQIVNNNNSVSVSTVMQLGNSGRTHDHVLKMTNKDSIISRW